MAVMAQGKVILQGKPADLTETLKGKVWRKTVSREVLKVYQSTLNIISTRSLTGKTQVHVLAESCPDSGFEPFYPGMEDVYFSALFGTQNPGKEGISC
ncbi:hypothetical protein D3C71_1674730 [compost metagenome]